MPLSDEHRADRLLAGAPPVAGILLGPCRPRRRERRVVRGRRREQRAVVVEEQRAGTARADVDARRNGVPPLTLARRLRTADDLHVRTAAASAYFEEGLGAGPSRTLARLMCSPSPCIEATTSAGQERGEDAVALHALRAERVRVGAVRDEHRRDDGLGMAPLDRRLEVAVERRVLRGDDRIVRLVDQLDLDRRIAEAALDFGDPLILASCPAARGSRGRLRRPTG